MSSHMRISSLSFALLSSFASLTGCVTGPESPGPTDEREPEQISISEDGTDEPAPEPQTSAGGNCCWGRCNNTGYFKLSGVSQDCRQAVVNTCHYFGYDFNPNGDALWAACQ